MKKKLYKLSAALMVIIFSLTGCTNFLDVKPTDRMLDEELFKTPTGFRSSLNGIYLKMNDASLYGGEMLFNFVEIIAQRYKFDGLTGDLTELTNNHNYENAGAKSRIQNIWERYYELIANCNKLIYYSEKIENVLSPDERDLILAEAKALRAFFHFDVLRLWGPIYSANPNAVSIPYNTEYKVSASDLLPASKAVEKIIADLTSAATLLKRVDPIIEKGPQLEASEDGLNIDRFRTQRLNYYAVKALLARVYQYAGQNSDAATAAREVIAVQEKWFPFISPKNIVGNTVDPDRVFSSELLFSLANSKRDLIFETNFMATKTNQNIYAPKKHIDKLMFVDKDYRYTSSWLSSPEVEYRVFHKYEKIEVSGAYYSNIIPLIRMSEMYYIVAECTTDNAEALTMINTIYTNRGLDKVNEIADLNDAIKTEYMKEFYGEGQLFFYYKRHFTKTIFGTTKDAEIEMNESKYVLPLPQSETDYR